MGTKNPRHRYLKKEVFWQHHIDSWSKTALTQSQYCRENHLAQSDFSKWKKKLRPNITRNSKKKLVLRESYIPASCSFCSRSKRDANKLFYGPNETVAICDYCLWLKARSLHHEVKTYKNIRVNICSVCSQNKPGEVIGNVYYNICFDCLVQAWSNIFKDNPEKYPCNKKCVSCGIHKEKIKHKLQFKNHFICSPCLSAILNKIALAQNPAQSCSFCHALMSMDNRMYGSGHLWICRKCTQQAEDSLLKKESAAIPSANLLECLYCKAQQSEDVQLFGKDDKLLCIKCINQLHHEANNQDVPPGEES